MRSRKIFLLFSILIATSALLWFLFGTTRSFAVQGGQNKTAHLIANVKTVAALPFTPEQKLNGESNGRVNVLVLGMSGPGYESPELTDTILIASLNTQNKKVSLISIPRDLLIELPNTTLITRVNTLYLTKKQDDEKHHDYDLNHHTQLVTSKMQEITGLPISYVVLLNVMALEDMVNALGGVNVFVDHNIDDPMFPTTGYGHEKFTLERGWRLLDGATAQKYVRTRHDIRGDFGRMERQQQVIGAIISKARGLNLITDFPKIISLVSTLGNNIQTNANTGEIKRAWSLSKGIDITQIKTMAIDGGRPESLLVDYHPQLGTTIASTLVPREGIFDYSEIQQEIQKILQ